MFSSKAVKLAKKHQHEEGNDGHKIQYSIHDGAWWCDNCDWLELSGFNEEDIDKLVAAEYDKIHTNSKYLEEIQ